MQGRKIRMLTETIQTFLNRGAIGSLQKITTKSHVADIALVFRALTGEERQVVFSVVRGLDLRAALLGELDPNIQQEMIASIPGDDAARILETMDQDDAADLLGYLDESTSAILLEKMHREGSLQVEGLLGYPSDSAGGIMNPDFVALSEDTSASDAIDVLRASADIDMVFYLYVTNDFGHLVGVVSLRNLVTVPPRTKLSRIMESRVIRVRPETDQEEVASLVARYNFLAVPVVDEQNVLMGIVTVDDIIDVIQEEAQEDMLKLVGAGGDLEASRPFFARLLARLPWAALTALGGAIGALLVAGLFRTAEDISLIILASPLLFWMSATTSGQSATFVSQLLGSELLASGDGGPLLIRETAIGMILGALGGIATLVLASLTGGWDQGAVVGIGVWVSVTWATLFGAYLPLIAQTLRQDIHLAAGPLARIAVGLSALAIYRGVVVALPAVFLG